MSSSPVANGSSVPACPVLAPVTRRICATIANDDGPAGLSTSATPAGSSARGGTLLQEALAKELGDVLDRLLGREPSSLPVATASEQARDRGDVELIDARAQRDAARRAAVARRLADQRGELGALDGSEVVDDPLGVRLCGTDLREVRAHEVRDDDPPALEDPRTFERAREQLQLRELDRLVHLLEHGVHVCAGFDELGREAQRLGRRVRVLE